MDAQDEQQFRHLVDRVLRGLIDQIDLIDTDAIDARFSAGSLTVQFETGGTFVLSQQTPTRELWLSANLRAWHFLLRDGLWVERDTAEPMVAVLGRLFSDVLGQVVVFAL